MKKNGTMRAAVLMLALTIITSCFAGGTFAKYVTAESGSDTARVAKFGVTVGVEGSLFADTYKDAPETSSATITVDSDNGDKVVAPGTNNGENTLKFTITGQPEVDVKLDINVADTYQDVFLKAKTGLPDMTTANETDTFNLENDYYPIQYTLMKGTTPIVENVNLEKLKTALEGIAVAKVDANSNLGDLFGTYTISWKWAFEGAQTLNEKTFTADTVDKADTLLGDLAAGTTLKPTTTLEAGKDNDYNLNTALSFSISVTQIN